MMKQNLYTGLNNMKILLLEDELMLNNAINQYLTSIGHQVESFTDGQAVVDSINNSYDLLILDINVPTLDGFEILTILNSKKIFIPTIFISALSDIEDITKGYNLGCKEYLKKPFHLAELGIKINQILKSEQQTTSHIKFSKNYSYSKTNKTLYFNNEPQNLTKNS